MQDKPIKYCLVFLPMWNEFYPPAAMHIYGGYLKERGYKVTLLDFNVEFFRTLYTQQQLKNIIKGIKRRKDALATQDYNNEIQRCFALVPFISRCIPHANQVFSDPKCFSDPVQLNAALRIYSWIMYLLNLSIYPNRLFFYGAALGHEEALLKNGCKELVHTSDFFDVYQKRWVKAILEKRPEKIGISLTNFSQFGLAVKLAHRLNRNGYSGKVEFGGCFVDSYAEILKKDAFLCSLVKLKIHDFEMHKNVIKKFPFNSSISLKKYFSPYPLIGLPVSMGCYWNKCSYCSYNKNTSSYVEADVENVIFEIKKMAKKDIRFFHLDVSVLSPSFMRTFANKILENKLNIRWTVMIRPESNYRQSDFHLFSKAGCRLLTFGIESGSKPVLDNMCKGIELEAAKVILKFCKRYQIDTNIYFIYDFPGEDIQDLKKTLAFIAANKTNITSFAISRFHLCWKSHIYTNPKNFGIMLSKSGVRSSPYEQLFPKYRFKGDHKRQLVRKEKILKEFFSRLQADGGYIGSKDHYNRVFFFIASKYVVPGYIVNLLYCLAGIRGAKLPSKIMVNKKLCMVDVKKRGRTVEELIFPQNTCNIYDKNESSLQLCFNIDKPMKPEMAYRAFFKDHFTRSDFNRIMFGFYLDGFVVAA